MCNNFVHLLIHLGYLFYEQYIGFVQSSIVGINLILVLLHCYQLLLHLLHLLAFFVELYPYNFHLIFLAANFAQRPRHLFFYSPLRQS
jgi:hypothetical protein